MRIALILCMPAILFLACSREALYAKDKHSLDSALVVVQNQLSRMSKTDTGQLKKAVEKFTDFDTFIKTQVSDTLTKEEAMSTQQFYESGNYLLQFEKRRIAARKEFTLMQKQLRDLIETGNQQAISPEQFSVFAKREMTAAASLTELEEQAQTGYYKAIQDFKNALPKVEDLIKKRNRGNLPLVIKDSVSI
jgi:hypothetical protein